MRYITQMAAGRNFRLAILDLYAPGGDRGHGDGEQIVAVFKDADLAEEVKDMLNERHKNQQG